MTPDPNLIDFKRGAVRPVECIQQGWDLIKDQYWLFLGMAVVGTLIGSAVPLGILTGPMMCGLYLALLKRQAGEPVEFATLFKGFDFFVDGMIAGILHAIPMIVIIAPLYLVYVFFVITQAAAGHSDDPTAALGFLGVMAILAPIALILLLLLAIGFVFAYPLIVDRRLSGVNAVKLSFRAGMANFWSLLGLLILNGLLSLAGGLFCGIGAWFVLPITISALAVAYMQVFGVPARTAANTPPLPPTFN